MIVSGMLAAMSPSSGSSPGAKKTVTLYNHLDVQPAVRVPAHAKGLHRDLPWVGPHAPDRARYACARAASPTCAILEPKGARRPVLPCGLEWLAAPSWLLFRPLSKPDDPPLLAA